MLPVENVLWSESILSFEGKWILSVDGTQQILV
jgi:hypothetical protein